MATTQITSDLLDKLDRFRSQATEELQFLNLPEDLNIALRQAVDRAILKNIDAVLSKQSPIVLQQSGYYDYPTA